MKRQLAAIVCIGVLHTPLAASADGDGCDDFTLRLEPLDRLVAILLAEPLSGNDTPMRDLDTPATEQEAGKICHYDDNLTLDGSYQLTPQDLLLLAKVIDGETWGKPTYEDASMMLWTLAQRKRIVRMETMARLAQAYSQPINPIWTRSGKKCRVFYPGGKKFPGKISAWSKKFINGLPKADYRKHGLGKNWTKQKAINFLNDRWSMCDEKRVDRRYKNIHTREWKDLAEVARETTLAFAVGKELEDADGNALPRDPRAIGWFAPKTWRNIHKREEEQRKKRAKQGKKAKRQRKFAANVDGNVYYADEEWAKTNHWTDDTTVVVPAGTECPIYVFVEASDEGKPQPVSTK